MELRNYWKSGTMAVGLAAAAAIGGRYSIGAYLGAAAVFLIGYVVVDRVRPNTLQGWSGAWLTVMAASAAFSGAIMLPIAPVAAGVTTATIIVTPVYVVVKIWNLVS